MTLDTSAVVSKTASKDLGNESLFLLRDGDFYRQYDWSLNIYPSVSDSLAHLQTELSRCTAETQPWCRAELLTNIFLHCCAIADTTDDYLFGSAYDLSPVTRIPFSSPTIHTFNSVLALSRRVRQRRLATLLAWRRRWDSALLEFIRTSLLPETAPPPELLQHLQALSGQELPVSLLPQASKAPAAFRSQDVSHHDIFALGREFLAGIDDPQRPILIIGLRTAGSYFAPLLAGYLQASGCSEIDFVSLSPKKGVAPWERAKLTEYAAKGCRAVLIDEPINTGKTLLKALDMLRTYGFRDDWSIVVPVHPSRPDWSRGFGAQALSQLNVVTLQPERWYKCSVLSPNSVASLCREWLIAGDVAQITVSSDQVSERANQRLLSLSEKKFHDRLKRVYRVDLHHEFGRTSTGYVFAKGVGWGWYGYHAVLASDRLRGFVPRVVGFRDGLLFEEWAAETEISFEVKRQHFVDRAAEYVAERSRCLRLNQNPIPALAADNRHKATNELSAALGAAYGSKPAATLRRSSLRDKLLAQPCPPPTLIDGKMRPQEWINIGGRLVKADFEQHGLGKTELNAVDPAYDLADAVLQWRLSAAEESRLVDQYVASSGDSRVAERLYLNKLLAGFWNMMRASDNLADERLTGAREKFNRAYIDAWNFLTVHASRLAGQLCDPKPQPGWCQRLVVIDVDGVLDRQVFGFPSTTAAGIRAISLLHAHGWPVAINTARSVAEVKEYCAAYRMAGGIAEYGAYMWDAVSGRERVLVCAESCRQLAELADQLRRVPGVFLNDDYKYSIRAFTYQNGVSVALPLLMVQSLISELKLDRLIVHQTFLDSAVVAKETNKGRGLLELLAFADRHGANVVAIGDSEPDLPMFRVVKRSYAPAQILCKHAARLLGCQIVSDKYQLGFLNAARRIVHEGGGRCTKCAENDRLLTGSTDLFTQLFQLADRAKIPELLKALLNPKAIASLRQ